MESWSQELVIDLIERYKEHPELWDPTSPNFKDRNIKNQAWCEIASALKVDKTEVQLKMRYVIGQFRREYKKQKSGSGTEKKIKWFAFEYLQFLKDKYTSRKTIEAGLEPIQDDEEERENINESEEMEEAEANIERQKTSKPRAPKRKNDNEMLAEAYSIITKISNKSNKDHLDVFGENVACQLREIKNPQLQMIAKHKISKILFETSMAAIGSIPISSASTSTSSTSIDPLHIPNHFESDQPHSPSAYTIL